MFDNITPSTTQKKSSMADFLNKNSSNINPKSSNTNNTNENKIEDKNITNTQNKQPSKISMNDFLSQKSNKIEEKKKIESPKKEKKTIIEQQEQTTTTQQTQQSNIIDDKNKYEEIIECKTLPLTDLGRNDNITIEISSPQKIEGGIFSKSYITFLVSTIPLKLQVRRRYSDFEWLRNLLINLYPTSVIPFLPKKSSFGDRFNEVFLNKRMRFLEKFMKFLITDPLIRNSKLLYEFLCIENENDFNTKKNFYNKLKPPSNLNEIATLTGYLNIRLLKQDEKYINSIKENSTLHENIIKKIKTSISSLNEEISSVCNRFDEISELFFQFYQSSSKFSENSILTLTYKLFSKYMRNFGNNLKKHNEYINIDLKEYLRYIRKEFIQIKNLESQYENQRNTFLKSDEKLRYRKEDLFKKGDISKWELNPKEKIKDEILLNNKNLAFDKMLDKDTKLNLLLKKNYAYYNIRIIEEYERLIKLIGTNMKDTVMNYCKKETACITELQAGIGDIIMSFQILDNEYKK